MAIPAAKRRSQSLPYISLPNILSGRFVVPEILQDDATPENLCQALLNQIGDKAVRERQERQFRELHRALRQNTRERLVETLVPMLSRRTSAEAATPAATAALGA